ncbi:hypothetical protein Tco_1312062 [Tanacetum coccineum]
MLHLGENSGRWSNLVGELAKEYLMYYPSWHKIKEEKKVGVLGWLTVRRWLLRDAENAQKPGKARSCAEIGSRSLADPRDQQGGDDLAEGSRHQYADGEDMSINKPRGTYIDTDVDEIKEDSKRIRKELNLLRKVARSDDRVSQLLTQLESQHEVGGGSRSGGGGDDEQGGDEDAGGDEEI